MLYGGFQHGWIAVGTTPVQLTTESVATTNLIIKSATGNGAQLYLGSSPSVTADQDPVTGGFELSPGGSVEMEMDNTQRVWLVSTQANQMACWIGV